MNVNLLNARICISSEGLSALIAFIAFERPKGLAIELRLPDPTGICLDEETKGIKWKLLLVQKKKKKSQREKIEPSTQLHQAETSLGAFKGRLVAGLTGTEALGH